MRVVVVGAGPDAIIGALACDPGPIGRATVAAQWRPAVHHPHVFRAVTRNLLRGRLPDMLAAVLAASRRTARMARRRSRPSCGRAGRRLSGKGGAGGA
jgi:hypothetical protein